MPTMSESSIGTVGMSARLTGTGASSDGDGGGVSVDDERAPPRSVSARSRSSRISSAEA